MKTFTPWIWGAIVSQAVGIALYVALGRHSDPVGWGFVLVANAVVMMLASVGTEIVHAIRGTGP